MFRGFKSYISSSISKNLPDMRHKSALSWKIPTLQFALDSFQAADRIKQRLLSFCGQDGQLFPCGPNSLGIIVYYRCSWAAHDINQWYTADLPLWDARDYISNTLLSDSCPRESVSSLFNLLYWMFCSSENELKIWKYVCLLQVIFISCPWNINVQ